MNLGKRKFVILNLDSVIPSKSNSSLQVKNNDGSSSKWKVNEEIFKWKKDRGGSVNSCAFSIYLIGFQPLDHPWHYLAFQWYPENWKFCFLVRTLNFIFLRKLVLFKSSFEMLENGITSSKHFMQYQAYTHCWRYWYVDKVILLHFIWIQEWHLSYWIAWWLFATALLHILHGNFTAIKLYV